MKTKNLIIKLKMIKKYRSYQLYIDKELATRFTYGAKNAIADLYQELFNKSINDVSMGEEILLSIWDSII